MRLIDVEVGRYDWQALACGCGRSAAHLANDLVRLARAQTREEADELRIHDHALIQPFPQEPAVPVTAVLMAALSGDLTLGARVACLDLLLRLVDTDDEDSAERCRSLARQGLWGLYRDLWSNAHRDVVVYAYLVLRVIETDDERLRTYRDSSRIKLPEDLAG